MSLIVCITGASRGIGRAISYEYARKGAELILASRGSEELSDLKTELEKVGATNVHAVPCDFSKDGAKILIEYVMKKNIVPDIAILNAGLGSYGPFITIPQEKNDEMIAVNITALTELARSFGETMHARGSGQILLTASTAAFQAGPLMATYFATKAYVLSLGLALREEFALHGIQVSVLCPGPTQTNFSAVAHTESISVFDTKRTDSAEHVARVAVEGLQNNKAIIIPGIKNAFIVFLTGFVPKTLAARIVFHLFMKKKE